MVKDKNLPAYDIKTCDITARDIKTCDIEAQALDVGFDAFGISAVSLPDYHEKRLKDFIQTDNHGTMDWMSRRLEQRADPRKLWPDVQSILVLGLNYGPEDNRQDNEQDNWQDNPLEKLRHPDRANVSVYAQNYDYHDLVKKRLKKLGRWLVSKTGCEIKVFVDTAPVLERALAAQSGMGWQGKHTNVVSRDFGSWLFLGEIFTNLNLPSSTPVVDHCGSCSACMDVCPTGAIYEPYKLDARSCISYLTIEHEGPVPHKYRRAMGNRIFGCDDCLAVCPWNKFALRHQEPKFQTRSVLEQPQIGEFLAYDETRFRTAFSASPVKRIGIKRFLRNVAIAAGNSGNRELISALQLLCLDDTDWVREAAEWAIRELSFPDASQAGGGHRSLLNAHLDSKSG